MRQQRALRHASECSGLPRSDPLARHDAQSSYGHLLIERDDCMSRLALIGLPLESVALAVMFMIVAATGVAVDCVVEPYLWHAENSAAESMATANTTWARRALAPWRGAAPNPNVPTVSAVSARIARSAGKSGCCVKRSIATRSIGPGPRIRGATFAAAVLHGF